MPERVKITFRPSGKTVEAPKGASLYDVFMETGVEVDSVCGGHGRCGKCVGRLVEGSIGPPTLAEERFLSAEAIHSGQFLLCRRTALGDALVEIGSAFAREMSHQPDKGELTERFTDIDPHVSKVFHELPRPTTVDQTADLERLLRDLPACREVDPNILRTIPTTLREADFRSSSVLFQGIMIAVEKGDTTSEVYGAAFDIGTTTVAGYLLDLRSGRILSSASRMNAQASCGADVLSRISHAMKRKDGFREMQQRVLGTVDEVAAELVERSGVQAGRIYVASFVGNTVMSHFLLGVSAAAIAAAPFVPAFTRSITTQAEELGLKRIPGHARCILLPNIAGYVGADTVGLILATGLCDLPGNRLAIDVGTNGEIVLASEGELLTCSTAAGPAFEGGCIGQGMRAEMGAIYRVDMDEDVRIAAVGEGRPRGICGSGLIDAVSEMVRVGILDDMGRMVDPNDSPFLPHGVKSRIRPAGAGREFLLFNGDPQVRLTQKDISELQLAKGAIRAGVEVLLEKKGLSASDLDEILLGGAFGSRLRPRSVKGIGLLPDIPLDRIKPVGNAAGRGAILALLSRKQLDRAVSVAEQCRHVELSLNKAFSLKFSESLTFPAGPHAH